MATTTSTSDDGYTAATPRFIALTTPFVQPSVCGSMRGIIVSSWKRPISSNTFSWNRPFMISTYDTNNPTFASCVPPGEQDVIARHWAPGYQVIASPAVCPQSWETFRMSAGPTEYGPEAISAAWRTSAACCPGGYTVVNDPDLVDPLIFEPTAMPILCTSTFTLEQNLAMTVTINDPGARTGELTVMTTGTYVAPIWEIMWDENEASSLSPRPPIILRTSHWNDDFLSSANKKTSSTSGSVPVLGSTSTPSTPFNTPSHTPNSTAVPSLTLNSTAVPSLNSGDRRAFKTIGLLLILIPLTMGCIALG